MKQNTTLLISLGLTVFILVVIAGILNPQIVMGKGAASQEEVDAQVMAALAEREAEYNRLLSEANQRLEQANQQIAAMSGQGQAPQAAQPAAGSPYIEAGAAQQAAQAAAGDAALVKAPELVEFEGKAAYEVGFDQGNVYVDAASGEVLMNGTVPQAPREINQEEAVAVAQDYMGLQDIYLADIVTISGQELYRVIFSAGHFVYMDRYGQITYVQMYNPSLSTTSNASFGGDGGGGGGYYDDDDHDDDHDDDDDHDEYEDD